MGQVHEVEFAPGQTIVEQGAEAETMFILLRGRAVVSIRGTAGADGEEAGAGSLSLDDDVISCRNQWKRQHAVSICELACPESGIMRYGCG
eukprot:COSAG01_NODE_246_length_20450_cov_195.166822_15_plen_91_part_00